MNGELATLVAICLHGNLWLASRDEPAPAMETENSTFRYVRSLTFHDRQRTLFGQRPREVEGTAGWLRDLGRAGVRRLTLITAAGAAAAGIDDHLAASFANGGRWAIVSDGPDRHIWHSAWSVTHQDEPHRRIWSVAVTGLPFAGAVADDLDTSRSRESLRDALIAAEGFADDNDLRPWGEWFGRALGLLDDPEPTTPYNSDLAPVSLSRDRRQLLAAAVQSWVFGGMGSWNDVGFADGDTQRAHIDLTRQLYAATLNAVETATNDQP